MKEEEIYNLLKLIIRRLEGVNLDWRLDGSANLLVQGIDLKPNDLDIATNDKGLDIFYSQFNKFVVENRSGEKFEGRTVVLEINGKEVEINSYEDSQLEKLDCVKFLNWKDLIIPTLPLEEAKKFYERINREEKVKILTDKLKINKQNE